MTPQHRRGLREIKLQCWRLIGLGLGGVLPHRTAAMKAWLSQRKHEPETPSAQEPVLAVFSSLDRAGQQALAGLIALVMGRRAQFWSPEFCKALLQSLMCRILHFPPEQYEAMAPLCEPPPPGRDLPPAQPFLDLLPPDGEVREALVQELLVALVMASCTEHSPLMVGYDARTRQLLVDLAGCLGVPWSHLAEHETQIAMAMRSQLAEAPSDASPQPQRQKSKKWKRRIAIGAAGLARSAVTPPQPPPQVMEFH